MSELTPEQQRSLDAFPETPARALDPTTGRMEILLPSDDFDWIRGRLGNEPDLPRRTDPRTGKEYALVPEDRYERFKAFFEEDPLTPAEKQALLREAGKRAGWDRPGWTGGEGSGEIA